jgi:hypothetical protein
LLIKIFLEKDLDIAKERRYKEMEGEEKGKDGERMGSTSGEMNGSLGSAPLVVGNSNNSNSGSGSNSSSSSSRGGITSATIMHIFDSDMIQLVMQDVIGMTSHGISTFTTQGGALERTTSQDREVEKDKEGESKDGYSRIDSEERTGEDFEKGGKRDVDKDSSSGLSDASGLRIELLKVRGLPALPCYRALCSILLQFCPYLFYSFLLSLSDTRFSSFCLFSCFPLLSSLPARFPHYSWSIFSLSSSSSRKT